MIRLDDITLMAYADGELDAAAMRGVADALAQDPEAQEKVHQFRLSASLVGAAFRDPAHRQVPAAAAEIVTMPPATSSARLGRRRFALPIAASILAGAIFGGGFMLGIQDRQAPSFSDRLLDEIADYHLVYARETDHQVEVPARRLEHIQAWLGARLHRTLRVPDLSGHGLAFEGARLLVVDGKPVAQLVYSRAGRPQNPLALCITFGTAGKETLRTESREGVNLALWGHDGYTYVLVGWAEKAFLAGLAAELGPKLDDT